MKVSILGVGLLALTSTLGFAQAAPQPMQRHAVTINQRREHQQQRIAQGIRSGRLNARQAVRLERREVSIGRQERHMRAFDHGGRPASIVSGSTTGSTAPRAPFITPSIAASPADLRGNPRRQRPPANSGGLCCVS